MKLSAKTRYALAAVISLAQVYETGEYATLIRLAEKLKISKIYLEQIFSLLKRGELVTAMKGAQGGYRLTRQPQKITAYDILAAIETSLFMENDVTVAESAPGIEQAMQRVVFNQLDETIKTTLSAISLEALVTEVEKDNANHMYYL